MWECAMCRKRMFKSSGIHRMIRTKSGNFRVAGLCPACAACQDNQETNRGVWKTMLVFSGIALFAGALAFFFMMVPK